MVGTVTSSTSTKVYYIRNYRVSGAPCVEDKIVMGYSNETVSSRRRLKDSRVRPTDLLASMTAQPLVYQQRVTPGIFRKEYNGTVTCDGKSYPYIGYDQQSPIGYGSYIDPPLPPWQNKVRERIGGQTVNLASSCAEYRETGKQFSDMAKGVRDAWNDMRKLRFGKWLKPKRWAEMHLGFVYGVKPLVEEVAEASVKLNAYLGFPPRGVVHTSETDTEKYVSESPYGGTRIVMSTRTARACIVYRNSPGRQLVHAGNPLSWAWELTPFSFVLDWGIQVGDWLTNLDALRGVDVLGGVVSDKIERVGVADYVPYAGGYRCIKPVVYTYKSHSRATTSSVPMARLRYEPSVTLERVKNALALLTTAKSASPSKW